MKRWLCLILAMAVCCAPMTGWTSLAEELEAVSGMIEAEAVETEIEIGDLSDAGEAANAVEAEVPEAEVDFLLLPEPETADEAEAAQNDKGAAAEWPRYVRALSDLPLTGGATVAAGGFALAISALDGGLVRVAVHGPEGLLTGDVPEAALELLTGDALAECLSALAAIEGATLYEGMTEYPLPELAAQDVEETPAVAAVAVNRSAVTIGVEEFYTGLSATAVDAGGQTIEGAALTWSSAAEDIVVVDSISGMLIGLSQGTVNVSVAAENGVAASVSVTVAATPESMSLSPESAVLRPGETVQLSAAFNEGAGCGALEYVSGSPDVASVDADGLVTALQKGEAVIRATAYNGKFAECAVTVLGAPASIEVEQDEITLLVGRTAVIAARALDADGEALTDRVAFAIDAASADPGCITLDADTGEIAGVRSGEAVVRLTCGAATAACAVTVKEPVTELVLNRTQIEIGVKEVYTGLRATLVTPEGEFSGEGVVTWSSDAVKIARVDASTGAVTGVKKGTATIYALAQNGMRRAVTVTVKKAPSKLSVSPASMVLGPGAVEQLTIDAGKNAAAGGCTYRSSNPAVAVVDEDGLVTGVAKGSATITVTSFNGKWATGQVKVLNAPVTLTFDEATVLLAEGMTRKLKLTALDADGDPAMAGYRWHSDQPACVSVDSSGAITALSGGTAVVTATAGDVSAACIVQVVPGPASIALETSSLTLGVKEVYGPIGVTLTASDGSDQCASEITWSTSNAKVVAVDADGVLTAKKKGTATITARTQNGLQRTATVTVKKAPGRVTMASANVSISEGMTMALSASVDNKGGCGSLTYSSSDPAVVSVNEAGQIRGRRKGSAVITARTYNGKSATCRVQVYGAPAALSAMPVKLVQGMTDTVSATALDADGDDTPAELSFAIDPASADPGCISVDPASGRVTGLRRGEAVVRVTANGSISDTCMVYVLAAPAAIAFEESSVTIGVKETRPAIALRLTPPDGETDCQAEITWSSANPKYVRVDSDTGELTGVKAGSATIYARTHNGLQCAMTVRVGKAPSKLTVTPASKTIETGDSFQLTATVNQGAVEGTLTYRSSKANVAMVSADGLVTGLSAGTATITVSTFNGRSATCAVTVVGEPKTLSITPNPLSLTPGTEWQLVVKYGGAVTTQGLSYESSDPTVASVDAGGKVRALSAGSATITATSASGARASCVLNVIGVSAQVLMDTERMDLYVGNSQKLNVTVRDARGTVGHANYTFRVISGQGVASVDASGNVTALSAGTAVIGVTTHDGVSSHVDPARGAIQTVCTVFVSEISVGRIEMPAAISLSVGETATVKPVLYAATGEVMTSATCALTISGDAAALSGYTVTGVKAGAAVITARASNGVTATCTVTVTGQQQQQQRYRFFGAYEVFEGSNRPLRFAKNNTNSVWQVLSRTQFGSAHFEKVDILDNPSDNALRSGIISLANSSRDDDITVLYLCSHGKKKDGVYQFQTAGSNQAVTSKQLYSDMSKIRGKVILILDSCESGVFIDDMKSKLKAAGGRISVLAASGKTEASYYWTGSDTSDYDYFTYYLLYGMNYDMHRHATGTGFAADADGNGEITLTEFFNYGYAQVTANLPTLNLSEPSKIVHDQKPTWYAGGNGSLVIYRR